MKVFVDTCYYIARLSSRDQWHERALKAIEPGMSLVTSSLVINETISLLQARRHYSAALQFLREARQNTAIQILYPDPVIQTEGWNLYGRWGSVGANAVDCVNFALMHSLAIKRVFTFDQHFEAAGFRTLLG